MKTRKKEDIYLSNDLEKKNVEKTKNEVKHLSEDELDSVAGGVAPIIKPKIP